MRNIKIAGLGRARAGRVIVAAVVAASSIFIPSTTLAADPGAVPAPAISDTSTYASVCPDSGPAQVRCFALERTDIAPLAAGQVSPASSPSGLSPASLRSAYNLPSGSAGAGMTVAVVDAYHLINAESILATYRSQFGLPACTSASGCFRQKDEWGGTSYPGSAAVYGWASEIALDIEMVSAICPLCKILLVEAKSATMVDLGQGVSTAVALGANAVSNSYGTSGEDAEETTWDPYFNHPGVVITAATGDCGYNTHLSTPGCTTASPPSSEYPAVSPWVLAVGGTSLVTATNSRGWTETAWSNAGSGCSMYEPKPYWQKDSGCANRADADISAVANPNTGVAIYDPNNGGWRVYGGTSASSPIVAAAYMLAGRPAPGSYPFRRLYQNTASLYDVTSGSNGTCSVAYLCTAVAGYDGPTGIGTPAGTSALAPDVIALGAGSRNSCGLRSDGKLACWGYDGATASDAPPGTYIALSTSTDHSCAIDTAGALHCWGANTNGMAIPPSGTYVSVSSGPNDSCAIDTAGAIHCWGDHTNNLTAPPSPPSGGFWASVTVGGHHACAISGSGSVTCWGDSSSNKTMAPSGTYSTISAGTNHTCGLRNSGSLICWGSNASGQTGGAAGGPWLDVASGAAGSCALDIHGATACWGSNSSGQNSPPALTAGRVALGSGQGCMYLATSISCWGLNTDGQSTPRFSGAALPQAVTGTAYSADVSLSTVVVPAVSFTISAGSLPPGISLSASGHLSGTATAAATYNFTVRASDGIAPAATATMSIQVKTPYGAPTAVTAIRANKAALVSWMAPAVGSASITGYTVTSSPGGFTCTTKGVTNCVVSGLTNGQSYTFTVTATGSAGRSLPSAPSKPVIPATNPGAPTGVTGIGSDTQVVVSWIAPAANGSAISGYVVTSNPNGKTCSTTGATSCTVTGLTNRTPYRFTVVATNGVGPGQTSAQSPDVTPLVGSTYMPLTPNRLVDSRPGSGQTGIWSRLVSGNPISFQVGNRAPSDPARNVPASATAVTGNLTIVGQGSAGYLSLTPAKPIGVPGTSTLNVPMGDIRANGVTVALGAGGVLWVTFMGTTGASTDVVFDVTGYFIPNGTGSTYLAVTPNRLVDSRAGATRTGLSAPLASGASASFQVTNRLPADASRNIPASATAVTGNLTVVGQTSAGYLSLTPANPNGVPGTSTLNVPLGDIRANGVTVPLGAGGVLWVTFRGTAGTRTDVVFDVTGYFTPGSAGATYVPLAPNRLVDSRPGVNQTGLSAPLTSAVPAVFQVTGRLTSDLTRNVPPLAIAVTGNLTVTAQHSAGYIALTPANPNGIPATSTLNFPLGDNRANGVAVPLGSGGVLWLTFRGGAGTTTHVVFDVTGYFTM